MRNSDPESVLPKAKQAWLWGIGFLVFTPIFFRLHGGVYRDQTAVLDSGGLLTTLPLPISLLLFVAIIRLWPRNLAILYPAMAYLVGTAVVCVISLVFASAESTDSYRKALMLLQIVIPMIGLFVGLLVGADKDKIIARSFMFVLFVFVPWQLISSWFQNDPLSNDKLTHYLYVFSIYGHRQYVTLIFVCAYAYSMTSLWNRYRLPLFALSLVMFIYVSISNSYLTIFAYFSFLLLFYISKVRSFIVNIKSFYFYAIFFFIILITWIIYENFFGIQTLLTSIINSLFQSKFDEILSGHIPYNFQLRFDIWDFYAAEIQSSGRTLLFGHAQPMPRGIGLNPHNWYLDIFYTFGVIALVPIISLITYTMLASWRLRKMNLTLAWWLLGIVFFIVLVDNNFKSTLRQPYPGIFTYFIWGLLLRQMRTCDQACRKTIKDLN